MDWDRIGATLERLERQDAAEREAGTPRESRLRQVTPEVGRLLRVLVMACGAQRVIEIGTSGGYSTIWLASAVSLTGGRVTTLEIDPAKVAVASTSLSDAGLADVCEVVHTDAFEFLEERSEAIDFCFLDAEKEDYIRFFDLVAPLLGPGGLLVADNVISHEEELAPFVEHVRRDTRFVSVVAPIGRGELLAARLP
jgi:predicted O-methyltransferase YrrM